RGCKAVTFPRKMNGAAAKAAAFLRFGVAISDGLFLRQIAQQVSRNRHNRALGLQKHVIAACQNAAEVPLFYNNPTAQRRTPWVSAR
ncbi:MAG: hypothetical protein U1D06_00150, partial [Paracoccaceae bacterium]|nr:hypothetical protein [Paracoccaceae bacterium]